MTKKTILKRKIGDVFINGKSHAVYSTLWRKKSKDGVEYYEEKTPYFINEIEVKDEEKTPIS